MILGLGIYVTNGAMFKPPVNFFGLCNKPMYSCVYKENGPIFSLTHGAEFCSYKKYLEFNVVASYSYHWPQDCFGGIYYALLKLK